MLSALLCTPAASCPQLQPRDNGRLPVRLLHPQWRLPSGISSSEEDNLDNAGVVQSTFRPLLCILSLCLGSIQECASISVCLLEIKPWWLPFPHQVLKRCLKHKSCIVATVTVSFFFVKSMNSAPPLLVIIGELGSQGRHREGSLPPHSAWQGHKHCALQYCFWGSYIWAYGMFDKFT